MKSKKTFLLGAGITGLVTGLKSGFPIFEANDVPGGICSDYYVGIDGNKIYKKISGSREEVYRFGIGGGHWIFGADKKVLRFIRSFMQVKSYSRRSSVYFSTQRLYIPYPLQNNLRFLNEKISRKALREILDRKKYSPSTMSEWLLQNFGLTLCRLFFSQFHRLYTANFYRRIAPQDYQKSPLDISLIIRGSRKKSPSVGYNAEFVYPIGGLDVLVERIASRCTIHYNKKVVKINLKNKELHFGDNTVQPYDRLISTLPLNKMLEICGITLRDKQDPYTSVLVLNIGALRGSRCPNEHWLYITDSKSGFFRVGFYSNVDVSFLPKSSRKANNRVIIYVEKVYRGGKKPLEEEIRDYKNSAIKELKAWGFIEKVEVADSMLIDVAYTWRWPGSRWAECAISVLRNNNIYQIGRYGRWRFQGIADSIRDGLNWDKYAVNA